MRCRTTQSLRLWTEWSVVLVIGAIGSFVAIFRAQPMVVLGDVIFYGAAAASLVRVGFKRGGLWALVLFYCANAVHVAVIIIALGFETRFIDWIIAGLLLGHGFLCLWAGNRRQTLVGHSAGHRDAIK